MGVGTQLFRPRTASLYLEAGQRVDGLRSETDVRHDRNAGVDQRTDARSDAHATFNLDHVCAGFAHHLRGGQHGLLIGCLVSAEG